VETNKTVTIELSVLDAGGTILWYGNDTQQVKDGGNLQVSLARQYWTLPASLFVTASPAAIAYNPTAPDSSSVTFSIGNLTGAPDGAALSYSWKDTTGAEVGTGATLIRTAADMLGPSPSLLNDSEERTYTVEVTYTDASGSTVTSSGSATVTIATAPTLTLSDSGGRIRTEDGRQFLVLRRSDTTAVPFAADVLCYTGAVTYTWSTVTGSGVATLGGTSGSGNSVTPVTGGLAILRVEAELEDGRTLTRELDVYVLDGVINCDSMLGVSGWLILSDSADDSADLTASLWGLSGLSGVTCSWEIQDTSRASVTATGECSATVTPVAAGPHTMLTATLTYKGVSVTVSKSVFVMCITLSTDLSVMKLSDGAKTVGASVTGTAVTLSEDFSWTNSAPAVVTVDTFLSSTSASVTPQQGGLATITVTATIKDHANYTAKVLTKTIPVAVLEPVLGGSGLPAGASDPIVLTAGSTETAALTATLRGISSGVGYSWESGNTSLFTVSPENTSGTTVTPVAAGSDTVTATLTYGGVSVTASRDVSVAGITIGGSATHVWNAAAASHTMSLTVAPVGITAVDSYTTSAYTSSDTDVATVTVTGGGTGITVTAKKGGAATITAKATYGGRTLTATKEIAILKLNVTDGTGASVPATGSILTTGATKALTAVLEGIPAADVEYEWTSSDSAKISLSSVDEAATTLSGVDFGSSDITVTATYKETAVCTKTMAFAVALAVESLSEYLASLNPADYDADHPLVLPALAVTGDNWAVIDSALKANTGIYVDLSQTEIPVLKNLSRIFKDCTNLVKPPVLPGQISGTWASDGLDYAFSGCRNLTEAPVLPRLIKNMKDCFKNCTKLTKAPAIPSSVTSMKGCFYGCTNLSDLSAMTIPASCTDLSSCFDSCQNLVDLSTFVIPEGVRYMNSCFDYCQGLHVPPVIPASVTDMTSCFNSCFNLEGPVIIKANITDPAKWFRAFYMIPTSKNVTVKVRSDAVKQAIEDSPGFENNVTIVVDPSLAE
ncbi:MAG: leucine-rich repeat protein, partial [Treponema sp.]|nr:leucine-rich repeat protein [Treponema sp.]